MSKIQVLWPSSCCLKLSLSKRAEEKKYDKNKNVGLIRLTCLLTCLGKYFLPVKQFFFELIILARCYSMQHPLSQFPHKIAFSSWVFNNLRMTKIIYFSKNSDCGVNSEIGSYYSSQICMQIKENNYLKKCVLNQKIILMAKSEGTLCLSQGVSEYFRFIQCQNLHKSYFQFPLASLFAFGHCARVSLT